MIRNSIKTNYFAMPSDCILELQQKNKRFKARCFMEYITDMHAGDVKSNSFYSESWGVKSKGSVHKWIGEFNKELGLTNE